MNREPITFKSQVFKIYDGFYDVDDEVKLSNGMKCYFYAESKIDGTIDMTWSFDDEEMEDKGINQLSGKVTVTAGRSIREIVVETNDDKQITESFGLDGDFLYYGFSFELFLYPHQKVFNNKSFLPSAENDAILVVEGKKLHVNKAFLSYHSEFFRALFSTNFKEGQMNEIPIQDVNYQDFGLLLSTIHPNIVFPTDKTVEKILKLADRFKFPAAFKQAEHHLLHVSSMDDVEKLLLADKYGISKLLEKILEKLDSLEKMKSLKSTKRFFELSDETNLKLFKKMIDII